MHSRSRSFHGKNQVLKLCSWDDLYSREVQNHADDAHDEGTIWFSESNAEATVLEHLNKLHDAGLISRGHVEGSTAPDSTPSRFLDLGTGNGHMLFELLEEDDEGEYWHGELVGVDYSEASVQLARRIAEQKHGELPAGTDGLRFEQWDLLKDQPGDWLGDGFDIVLDKGTFDAISLMEHQGNTEHPCHVYRGRVAPLIKPTGFLCLTSCNWTKQELLQWLVLDNGDLEYFDEAKYPTFTFGGQTGQTIVTIILRKKRR